MKKIHFKPTPKNRVVATRRRLIQWLMLLEMGDGDGSAGQRNALSHFPGFSRS